ncbi:hypothetical protein B0H10DRAFT_2118174 [Mycena sp. CBHHK59/15]|nr:hypothetical protein B0H10DRAFT_2118174 [Mycena sp. CBHHK59/15]
MPCRRYPSRVSQKCAYLLSCPPRLHDHIFTRREETPTSATTSLPTPTATTSHCHSMASRRHRKRRQYLFQGTDGIITVPGAPLMKDYDSFTEGTAKGSFYSIPAASTDEYGDLIHPINALTLAALPLHDIAVARAVAPGRRRPPRCPVHAPHRASSDKGESRNCRARAESPPTPLPPPRARAKSFSSASLSIMNSFIWSSHFTRPPPLKLTHAPLARQLCAA